MNRLKKRFYGTILSILCCLSVNAQSGNLEVTKIVTHSPNSTSLGKYGDYPVHLANGVPEIGIPLYTINSGSLQIPISMSYHSGGIKVDEESSFIGLGWALNAGGVVTRVINDKDDFGSYGFSSRYDQLPDYNSIFSGILGHVGNSAQLLADFSKDKEPDLFSINLGSIHSTFAMDNDGDYISLDHEPLKFSINDLKNLIEIIDQFGNTYRFGQGLDGSAAYETTSTEYSGYHSSSSLPSSITSWYLTEIISADKKDTIKIRYQSFPYSSHTQSGVDRYVFLASPTNGVIDKRGKNHQGISYGMRSVSIPNARVIDEIVFKNGRIKFSLIDDRQDVQFSGYLHQNVRIAGFSVFDNGNNNISKIAFKNNNYFDRSAVGSTIIPSTTSASYEKKSLKITGVEFYDTEDNFVNAYKFDYNPIPLPPRNTTPQDLWGYFNGKSTAEFIPANFYTDNSPGLNHPVFIGSNRDPDPEYVKAGILQKITYPTKGYTSYEFEPNYYLSTEQQEGKIQKTKQISCFAINRLSTCPPSYLNGVEPTTIYEFTVNDDLGSGTSQVVANLAIHFSDYINYNGEPMVAKFYRVGDPAVIYQHGPGERTNSKTVNETFVLYKNSTYRIELYTNSVTIFIRFF